MDGEGRGGEGRGGEGREQQNVHVVNFILGIHVYCKLITTSHHWLW